MIERGLKLLEFLAKCPVFYLVTELLPRMWRKKTTDNNKEKIMEDITIIDDTRTIRTVANNILNTKIHDNLVETVSPREFKDLIFFDHKAIGFDSRAVAVYKTGVEFSIVNGSDAYCELGNYEGYRTDTEGPRLDNLTTEDITTMLKEFKRLETLNN